MPCLFFLFIRKLNKVINEHTDCYPKADDTLLKITIRGLLIESFEVLSVPRVGWNSTFFHLEFVVAR